MKFTYLPFVALIAMCFAGCQRSESTAYAKLKSETGATEEELEEGIKIYTKFYMLMRDEIEAGTVNADDLLNAAKDAKRVMTTVQRDDEMTAAMTLSYLRILESKGSAPASVAMARQLNRFVDAEIPSTDSSKMIREKIEEYAKTSEAFKALKQNSEVEDGQSLPAPSRNEPTD
jgi:hypothetical protein